MIFSKRMMLLNIFLLVLSAAVLWVSCDTTTNSNGDGNTTPGLYVNDPAEPETVTFREGNNYDYPGDTLNVDYNGDNNAVFFDFSTGTATELPHDFFDIAIDGDGNIIANSGSYGSGVQVYKTDRQTLLRILVPWRHRSRNIPLSRPCLWKGYTVTRVKLTPLDPLVRWGKTYV
jgi:hypothetical protein